MIDYLHSSTLFVIKQKVVANFAFRADELDEKKIGEIVQAVGKIVEVKK